MLITAKGESSKVLTSPTNTTPVWKVGEGEEENFWNIFKAPKYSLQDLSRGKKSANLQVSPQGQNILEISFSEISHVMKLKKKKKKIREPRFANKGGWAPRSLICPLQDFELTGYKRVQCPTHKCSSQEKVDRSQHRWKAVQGKYSLTISGKTEAMSKASHSKYEQVRYKEMIATSSANKQTRIQESIACKEQLNTRRIW